MKVNLVTRSLAIALAIASTLIVGLLPAAADTVTWTGGSLTSGNWNDNGNWTNSVGANVVPATADNLIFSQPVQPYSTNDLSGLSVGWLEFESYGCWLYGNLLTVSGGITNTASAGGATLGLDLALSGPQGFQSQSGTLLINGAVTNSGNTLTIDGSGDITIAGTISGAGGLIMDGFGTLTLPGAAATANTFTGGLTINSGIVLCSKANGSVYGAAGNGNIVVNNGATFRASGDNSLVGQTLTASRSLRINAGGTVDNTGTTTCHLLPVVLNGGTLTATTPNGTWGNWNLDFGVSTLTNGTTSYISGGNVTLGQTGGSVFNIGAGDTVSVSSVIAHTTSATDLGLIKAGAGVLELSAENTYTSRTVISNGTLRITTPSALLRTPNITVVSGGVFDVDGTGFSVATNQTLAGNGAIVGSVYDNNATAAISPGGNGTAGTLAIDTLMLNGNLALDFDLANVTTAGGVNDLLIVTNLNLSSGTPNIVNFSFLNGTPATGTYTLIQYISGPAAGPVTTLAAVASRYVYTFTSDGSSIKVTVTGTPGPLVWRGDGLANAWDINTSSNWMNGLLKDVFLQGDNATFNDAGSNNTPINITTTVSPTVVTVNATKSYTMAGSGKITGGAALLKSGSGDLSIAVNNDNAGNSSINGSGNVWVGNGTTLGTLGAGNLTNNSRVVFYRSDSPTYPGNMSGSGSVVKLGAGTLTMSGTNTFAGGLAISNGVVQIGNNPTVAGSSIAGPITNYGDLYFSRTDAFTNQSPITSAGITRQFGGANLFVRGAGGMTVDGSAPINLQGTVSVGQAMYGKLTINPGANITANNFLLGNPASSVGGDVFQFGGTVNSLMNDNTFRIAHWATEISSWTMNGGTLNVAGQLSVGWDGIGLLFLNNGIVNCGTLAVDGNTATAALGGTNCQLWLNGGRINIGSGGISGNTYTINLASGTIGANANWSSGLTMNLTNGSPIVDSSTNIITLSGVLSGSGGLTKQGAGALSLNGANTYTNSTTVAAGTLQGTGTIISPVTVQSGATISAGGTLGTGTLTLSNLTVNAGGSLVMDLSSTAATADFLNVKGALDLGTATPVTFNFLGGTPYTGGPYTILTNWVTPRAGTLSYVNPTRYSVNLDNSQANRIQVTFSGANGNLVWNGNINNLWNANGDFNWLNGGTVSKYFQSDAVIFDDNGTATPNVTLASDMSPASVTVNSSANYSFAGAGIVGVGPMIKSGPGTLTILNNLTHSGGTTVNAGTLQIGNGGTAGSIAGNIADFSSVVFKRSDALTYPGTITGPGTLTQAGTGTLLLTGNSSFFGGATVNAGSTVQLGNGLVADSGLLGIGPVNNQGSIIYNRASQIAVAAPHSGNGSLTFLGTGLLGQSSYSMNATNTFTGPVTLSLARLIGNVGALSLGNPSSITVQQGSQVYAIATPYSSVFNIPATVSGAGWWESSGMLGALRLQGGANWAGPVTLAGNTRLSAFSDGSSNVITGTIAGPYELELGLNASGFLALAPSAPNSFNALRMSAGTVWAASANAIPNNIPLIMNGGTLKLNGNNYTFNDFTAPGAGSIQNGSGTSPILVTLVPPANANFTYTGTFSDGGSQPIGVTINQSGAGAGINLSGDSSTWTGNFTNNGGAITISAGSNTRMGVNNLASRFLVFNNCALNITVNNALAGGNATEPTMIFNNTTVNSTRFGAFGPIVLNGSTLTGTITGDVGYYQYALYGGRVTVGGNAPSFMDGTGAGYGYPLQTPTIFNVADVTGNAAADLTVSAPLRAGGSGIGGSAGALIKTGAGKMVVTDVATYTGSTIISNGVLVLSGAGSLATSSSYNVSSGATFDVSATGLTLGAQTLSGSGTVLGTVTDGTGSIIAPGSSAGTLTISGNLTLNGSGNLNIELANTTTVGAGVNDLLQVNGDLTVNDSMPTPINFTFLNGTPAAGTYTIIKYTGNLYGTVAGLTNSAGSVATITVDTLNKTVQVTFTVPGQSLVWEGDGIGNAWDFATTSTNWFNGSVDTNFYQLDSVKFDDSRTTVNTTVTLGGAVTPSSMTLNSAYDYTFTGSGKITGNTSLTKQNTDTVTLGTVNDFTGPTSLEGGVLKLGAANALGATNGTVTITNNSTLDVNGTTAMNKRVIVSGTGVGGHGAIDNSGAQAFPTFNRVTLTGDTTFGNSVQRWDLRSPGAEAGTPDTADLTCAGGGAFNLTKVGPGYFSLCSATVDTNLANIDILAGSFEFNGTDTGLGNPTNTVTVYSGANFTYYNATNALDKKLLVLDGGTLAKGGGGGRNVIVGTVTLGTNTGANANFNVGNAVGLTFSNTISGPGALSTIGTGPLGLTVPNTYAGGTIINNAPLARTNVAAVGVSDILVANANALGSGPVTINSSLITVDTITNVVRALEFNLTAGSTVPNAINLPTATITNVSIQGRDNTSVFTLAGQIGGGYASLTNWFDSGTAGSLGTIRLANNANNFLCAAIRVPRGNLAITGDGCLGNSANLLWLDQAVANINGAALRFDTPSINVAHKINVNSATVFDLFGDNNGDGIPETANSATVSGIISGTAAVYVRGTNGTLTLSGANTCSGGFELQQPVTLQVAASANLGTAYVAIKFGSTFRYTGTGSETMTRTLWMDNNNGGTIDIPNASASLTWNPGGGTFNQNFTKTGAGALTFGTIGIGGGLFAANGGTLTVNSVISGNTMVQVNTGTLTLAGANTFVGPTLVNGGTLFVNGSLPVGNSVTVASGATLGGTGTINCPVALASGSALKPGVNAIGTLTLKSPLTMAGTTTMEINGTTGANDAVVGMSTVTYGGSLVVNNLGNEPAVGAKFTLFGAGDRLGSFASVSLPSLTGSKVWTNNLAMDGSIQVVFAGNLTPPVLTNTVVGSNLNLSWAADHIGWRLMQQTNKLASGVSANLADWGVVAGSTTTNLVTVPILTTTPTEFYKLVSP